MARLVGPIPELSAQERPIARLPARAPAATPVRSDFGVSGFGALGQSLQRAGQDVLEVHERIRRQQEKEQANLDKLRAEEALTELKQQQLDLTYGDDGFKSLKGADAMSTPVIKDWNQKFDDAQRLLLEGLSNDQQKQLFRERAAISRLGFQEDMLRHLATQKQVYGKQVLDSTLEFETQNAVAHWQTPAVAKSSINRMGAVIDEHADNEGWTPEAVAAKKREQSSKIHASIANRMISVDPFLAKKYLQQHQDQIDPDSYVTLQRAYLSEMDRRDRRSEKVLGRMRDRMEEIRTIQILTGGEDAPGEDTLLKDLADGAISGEHFRRLRTLAIQVEEGTDDFGTELSVMQMAADADRETPEAVVTARRQGNLSRETALSLYNNFLQSKEEGGIFSQEDVKEGFRIIDREIGGVRAIAAVLDSSTSRKVSNALKFYRKRIAEARERDPNADAIAIADEVVERFQTRPPPLSAFMQPLYRVGEPTSWDIDASEQETRKAFERGEIDEHIYRQEIDNFNAVRRARGVEVTRGQP